MIWLVIVLLIVVALHLDAAIKALHDDVREIKGDLDEYSCSAR